MTRIRNKAARAAARRDMERPDDPNRMTTVIPLTGAKRSDMSRQKEDEDAFSMGMVAEQTIATPYNLKSISEWVEQSNILQQCIDAMTTNIVTNGFRVVPIAKGITPSAEEESLLNSFIQSPNLEESLVGIQKKKVIDYEKYGFGFIEIVRNAKGAPSLLYHAKAYNIRLLKKDTRAVTVSFRINRGGRRSTVTERKRFRRFVQVIGSSKTYFKEFGDPRPMSSKTGEYQKRGQKAIPKSELATELLHHRQYSEDVYGTPRWISQLPSVLGSREAEEVNLRYFEDNTVPPMMLMVSGGRITKTSFDDITKMLNTGIGKDRQNQIVLVEAIAESASLDDKGSVQLKVEKLADVRPSDGLFKDYDDSNISKVRSSFRLPPVVIGMSQDVTFATANVSAYLAESQVFVPERKAHDEYINKGFINHPLGLNLQTVKLESRGPSITNPDQIMKTATAANVMGAMTPRSAIGLINEAMQLSLPEFPNKGEEGYEEWMDMPISLSQRLAVAMSRTQQTGEGTTTAEASKSKDATVNKVETTGETGVTSLSVENGQQ